MVKERDILPKLMHITIWTTVLLMPLFVIWRSGVSSAGLKDYLTLLILPASIIIVFYVNYLLLIDRFLFTGKFGWFALCNLLLIPLIMLTLGNIPVTFNPDESRFPVGPVLERPGPPFRSPGHPFPPVHRKFITGDIILYLLAIGVSVAVKATHNWYRTENRRQELERVNAHAELQNLKNQLNPHFLFNALNNIYSFIKTDPDQAQHSMDDLCRLLRYTLYKSDSQTVPFSEEIQLLESYISLIQVKFHPDAHISVNLPESPSDTPVAPMLLQPLVENAFKHGMRSGQDSFVKISVEEKNSHIICETENSLLPGFPAATSSVSSCIGLPNLKKRLEIIYKGKYMLEYGPDGKVFRTFLIIETN